MIQVSPSYLMENGYLEEVQLSEFSDGEPFAIFEDWDGVYGIIYGVIEAIIPEALQLYEKANLIKKPRWNGYPLGIEDIKIDGEVPEIVAEALDKHDIREWNIVEDALGCEFGFSDEYTTCSDCGKVIRTSPDSYSWQPDFYWGDGFIACQECFDETEDYQEAYIEEKINNPKNAINGLISENQLEGLGFTKINGDSFENGWHRGQDDNPEEIYDRVKNNFEEIIFFVDGVGQFDMHFSVWGRREVE